MIIVITKRPYTLLKNINNLIDNYAIRTWEYDSDSDYTHCSPQLRFHAWFRALVTKGEKIEFIIVGNTRRPATIDEYAIYHGKFTEMLITHFSNIISKIEITPQPTRNDLIQIPWDED